ncbi:putative nepenthesin [Medicago truncatula]|uniref:Eukaryotic aspartyl protease family protein n=1 Tax=Medicago truncatula TaxID=3880 RepID=A0A072TU33_MEDTR|nr:aspartic proteinase CDR1 [Medicago truncatula]KEH21034.1 eukaryotic aspartyl protease family protein [Medicago truncatula]RHN43313.1 putative nepenthesin [Medicago truncatula]
MNKLSFLNLFFFSLCFIASFSHALNNGFSVELIHRDSSKSPFYQPTQNKYQKVVNAARRSINRANHFYKNSLTSSPESNVIPDNGEYLMTYSIGSPPFKLYGIVDTGSDIVWLQCEPCEQCYNQTTPKFKPSKSSTYKNIPCSSNLCQSVRDISCNAHNFCEYTISYGDHSHSQGDLSVDTLTLESSTGGHISFPKTVIGCGTNNTVSFKGASSGIVGLGGGPVSLITQLGSSIGSKFSYCLLPLSLESNRTSKLSFGDAAVVSGEDVLSTPIVKKDPTVFYYLTLEAFSVGNKRIEFGRSSNGSDEGNIIIDSGTTLTILPSNIYNNLESAVAESVKLERVDDPTQQLNLCYSTTSDIYNFPLITAHFKGADIKLHPISTFVSVADDIVCFAFTTSPGVAIFGNLAQQNLLVGYDLKQKTVSFKPTDCSKV